MFDIFSYLEISNNERNTEILTHYCQNPDIYDFADFIGDSLTLPQQSTETDVILFCSDHFMCGIAIILNPKKRLILQEMMALS